MKKILFLALSTFMTTNPDFETFLGKDIVQISFIGPLSKMENDNMYWIWDADDDQFYGRRFERIFITTFNDKTIRDITLYFSGIDKSLYRMLSDEYGDADRILVIDEVFDEPEEEIDGQILKESFLRSRKEILRIIRFMYFGTRVIFK